MDLTFKKNLFNHCVSWITEEIKELQTELQEYNEAAKEETKSSAGDKYETGRAMIYQEQERVANQIIEKERMLKLLIAQKPETIHTRVGAGSLVLTSLGLFYFIAGIGTIKYEEQKISCLSMSSPLAQELQGLHHGDEVEFKNNRWKIFEII